jgi:hypothetical protein
VDLVALVWIDQRTDYRLSNHFLPHASNLELKPFIFRPLGFACPLLLG